MSLNQEEQNTGPSTFADDTASWQPGEGKKVRDVRLRPGRWREPVEHYCGHM